jgi:Asp/Glu/hydantoin racemase
VPLLKEEPAIKGSRKPVTGIFEASVAASLQLIHPEEKFGEWFIHISLFLGGRTKSGNVRRMIWLCIIGITGIVSTGKVWEEILTDATIAFLGTGAGAGKRFAGVETTGLNATDLHDAPAEEVRKRMKDAVKRLLNKGSVGAICLGCAGMAGMDKMVREACVEELGEEKGGQVRIVDGVVAGVAWLEGAARSGF